jgi:hypothetical protein
MVTNIVITLEGEVLIVTQEGTFEAGKEVIEKLLEELNLQGIELSLDKPIEQHRHGPEDHVYVRSHIHAH